MTTEEYARRIQAVWEYLRTAPKEIVQQPWEIKWLLACAAIREKDLEIIRHGKGII